MSQRSDMSATIGAMLDGKVPINDAVAILSALGTEHIAPDQLAGAVDAVMSRAVPFQAFPDAVDCCGTGGDGQHTFNISTAAAIIASACGVSIAKHGNRAVTSRSGSSDVLEALGVNTLMPPMHAAAILQLLGLCFLFAPTFHPGFGAVTEIRKAMRGRTIFNILGPLCNPAKVNRQLIGTFSIKTAQLIAQTVPLLGRTHVLVVHGEDGSDELSISGKTRCWEVKNGIVREYTISPTDAGLDSHAKEGLRGGDARTNANALRKVLDGETSAYCDAVLLNTAAVLLVAEKVPSLKEGVALARAAIKSGAAHSKLGALMEASNL